MSRSYRLRWTYRVMFLTLMAVITGWILVAGNVKLPELVTAALRQPTGSADLVYYDPLPAGAMDDEKCEWVPASAGTVLAAAPQDGAPALADASGKKPVRMIRDRYASYSAVAVDPSNNEVVLTDETCSMCWSITGWPI